MERAYGDLDPKHRGDMDRHTFVHALVLRINVRLHLPYSEVGGLTRRLGYTEADANKIFRKIDIDGNGACLLFMTKSSSAGFQLTSSRYGMTRLPRGMALALKEKPGRVCFARCLATQPQVLERSD
eukprot:4709431-Amphidinium_carterae.1